VARINIGGRIVEVGDDFLKMSPQDQQSTVDEIAGSTPLRATTQSLPRKRLAKALLPIRLALQPI
jgi:hypothetical protein